MAKTKEKDTNTTDLETKDKLSDLKKFIVGKDSDDEIFHTLNFFYDVPLRLDVEIARGTLTLREILSWKKKTVVPLNKVIGEPLEVLIEDRIIARGEVVVINNHYGIRISEITRPDEKVSGLS